jgi:hypothetical protein
MSVGQAAGYLSLIFCTRNAFAAWVYRSAAFSYFSVRPPNQLRPPEAPESALSAYFIARARSWSAICSFVIAWVSMQTRRGSTGAYFLEQDTGILGHLELCSLQGGIRRYC